jgi:hydrogenase expression/formation protein HypE
LKSLPGTLPVGKLPPELLARLLESAPVQDERILVGPGVGLDCAVVDLGAILLVFKTDPITFATNEIGWYAVQVNANDIATTGATPTWFLMTLLLPDGSTTADLVDQISQQVFEACQSIGVSVIGGHSEITHGLERPIVVGTLVGEVVREALITPDGARPGDRLLITKGVPVEAISILAREFPHKLQGLLSAEEISQASDYLYDPGVSILKDAHLATITGEVTAMHDPTEGGLVSALWELAEACGHTIVFDPEAVPIPRLAQRICQVFEIDPLAAIASGALLISTTPEDASQICQTLEMEGIRCAEIGSIESGPAKVWRRSAEGQELLPRPERDEIARVIDTYQLHNTENL